MLVGRAGEVPEPDAGVVEDDFVEPTGFEVGGR